MISLDETKTLFELKKDLKILTYTRDATAVRLKSEEKKLETLRRRLVEDQQRLDRCQDVVTKHKDNRYDG